MIIPDTKPGDPLDLSPHSVEAEEALLGSMLMNPEAFWDVQPHLEADDFFIMRHGWIYDAVAALVKSDMAVDVRTLADKLRNIPFLDADNPEISNRLDGVGGEAYLNYLPNTMPSALNAEYYAMLVERAAVRRRLIGACGDIAQLAWNEELETPEVLSDSQRLIMSVSFRKTATKTIHISDAASELYDKYEAARNNKTDIIGITSPFLDIDRITGGWQSSHLILVGGRPGMGKSAFLLQCALHAAQKGKHGEGAHVAFFSAEMDYDQIVARAFAQVHGITMRQQRRMTDAQWKKFVDFLSDVSKMPLYINDSPALTPTMIARECREQMRLHGPLDMIYLDYLQRYKADRRSKNKWEEVGSIAESLKELSRELRIPVMAAVQLSRACEQPSPRMPRLSDLAESAALEREADLVIFPYRAGLYTGDKSNPTDKDNIVDCDIAKHRNGETATILQIWDGPSMLFKNYKHDDAPTAPPAHAAHV